MNTVIQISRTTTYYYVTIITVDNKEESVTVVGSKRLWLVRRRPKRRCAYSLRDLLKCLLPVQPTSA